MNVAKLKELISDLPDDMPVQLLPFGFDEEERTVDINEIFVHIAENEQSEQVEILLITF